MANELIYTIGQYDNNPNTFAEWPTGSEIGLWEVGYGGIEPDLGEGKGALRFLNVAVPQGTSVNYAELFIQVTNHVGDSPVKGKIHAFDEDNTADFTTNPVGRPQTSAGQTTDIYTGDGGTFTTNITSLANEVFARGGWSSGNALGFIFEDNGTDTGTGRRYVYSTSEGSLIYLAIRVEEEPDFTPDPVTVDPPIIPPEQQYGLKMARPGRNVLTVPEAQLYFTTRRRQFKVFSEGQTTGGNPKVINHNLGYIPFAEAFVKASGYVYRLPFLNYSGGSNIGYMEIDNQNLSIYTDAGNVVYYYIFLDRIV